MADLKQNPDDTQLHWFWRLTTKWWFFPAFYVVLALLIPTFGTSADVWYAYLISIAYMPLGIMFLLDLTKNNVFMDYLSIPFLIIFHIFLFSSIFIIHHYKVKKKIILKRLIILLLLFIILSFGGCVLDLLYF